LPVWWFSAVLITFTQFTCPIQEEILFPKTVVVLSKLLSRFHVLVSKNWPDISWKFFFNLSFYFSENLKKLAQQSNDDLGLSCVNGIKALSMLFILGGKYLRRPVSKGSKFLVRIRSLPR
jgi:hypothetical protein